MNTHTHTLPVWRGRLWSWPRSCGAVWHWCLWRRNPWGRTPFESSTQTPACRTSGPAWGKGGRFVCKVFVRISFSYALATSGNWKRRGYDLCHPSLERIARESTKVTQLTWVGWVRGLRGRVWWTRQDVAAASSPPPSWGRGGSDAWRRCVTTAGFPPRGSLATAHTGKTEYKNTWFPTWKWFTQY